MTRIPLLHGEPEPARRIMAATRLGARNTPVLAHAVETITDTAAAILPRQ